MKPHHVPSSAPLLATGSAAVLLAACGGNSDGDAEAPLPKPTAIRRTVCFSQAIVHGEMMANGEDGRSVKEVFPGLYRGSHTDVATERGFTGHSQSL